MKTLIVSRFNEDIGWIDRIKTCKVIIYNKGTPIERESKQRVNVGREAETYLNFIVSNYESLSGIYLFVQGDPVGGGLSENLNIFNEIDSNYDGKAFEYFKSSKIIECDLLGHPDHPGLNIVDFANKYGIKIPHTLIFSPGAQFIVSYKAIKSRSKNFYEKLITSVNHDIKPIESYILERLWYYIFNLNE